MTEAIQVGAPQTGPVNIGGSSSYGVRRSLIDRLAQSGRAIAAALSPSSVPPRNPLSPSIPVLRVYWNQGEAMKVPKLTRTIVAEAKPAAPGTSYYVMDGSLPGFGLRV
jgi:hypothetical protein